MRAIGSRAVSSSVLLRLARLPGEASTVARAVAVLGEGADLPAVAGVSGLDEAQVAGTMAALARAEILRPEPPPGFVHPLVRDAVYQGLPLGERELLHARAAGVLRRIGASLDQIAGQLMHTPRRGDDDVARLLHEAGNAAFASRRDRQRRRLPAARARGARAGRRSARGCCSTSARSRRSRAAPTRAKHLREAYDGLTDDLLRIRAANALGRALLFTSSPAEGAAIARQAAAALPPELADEALGLEAFALMGIPFGAGDPDEARIADECRHRTPTTPGEKMLAAFAALEWCRSGGHVDEVVAVALAALEGGEIQNHDPNLLTLAAMLPMIVGDRDEALTLFEFAMLDAHRRGSLFAVTGMYLWRGFTLFWRGDLIDAEEELTLAFDQAEAWGYGPDTLQWNAAHLSWCLTERGKLAARARRWCAARSAAATPTAPATGATRAWSC